MNTATKKDTRLVARVDDNTRELVSRAAELTGSTLTQFLVEAARTRAESVIERAHRIRLSMQGADAILRSMDDAPAPNARILAAAERYREVKSSGAADRAPESGAQP